MAEMTEMTEMTEMAENTTIELKDGDETIFVFPVSPESFELVSEMGHETQNINGLGQILLKGDKSVRTIGWTCFFPSQHYDFVQVNEAELATPMWYVETINGLMLKKKTVTLNIKDFISIKCVISKFTPGMEEKGKDFSYSITFMEDVTVSTPSVKKQTAKRPIKSVHSHMYKWKKGDTWKKVAKKETGKSANYSKLKQANKSRINKAKNAYMKKHNVKKVKEEKALIGTKILLKV
jgi:hypothetical protein